MNGKATILFYLILLCAPGAFGQTIYRCKVAPGDPPILQQTPCSPIQVSEIIHFFIPKSRGAVESCYACLNERLYEERRVAKAAAHSTLEAAQMSRRWYD